MTGRLPFCWIQRILTAREETDMPDLTAYYGKFNEDKRLKSRYGQVEFLTTMAKLRETARGRERLRILDVGAGTGAYSIALSEEGHLVTAVELVNYNLGILRQKAERKNLSLTAVRGNALDLSRIPDGSFDVVLLLGPLYHLFTMEEKVLALREAAKKLAPSGRIFAGYIMNDYAVLKYGFLESHILEALRDGRITEDFRTVPSEEDLFSYDRPADLPVYRDAAGLRLVSRFSQDGPTHYFRQRIAEMDDETFSLYMRYHLSVCEREDLLGAGCHTVEILARDVF